MPDAINPLRVLITKQCDWWVAQCLEYDLAVQARTLRGVQYEFQRIFFGRLVIAEELGVDPFAGISQPPPYYEAVYNDTVKTVRMEMKPIDVPPAPIPPHYVLPHEALVYEY